MKKIALSILLLAGMSSCDIDRFPYNSIESGSLFEDEGGLTSATLGNYSLLKGKKDESAWFDDWQRLAEYPGDNVSLSGTTTDNLFYFYNYKNIPNNSRSSRFWSFSYRAVVGCNKVIEAATEGQSETMDQLIGENYYIRALIYFQMANIYGRPYTQGRDNLAVPLKLSTDIEEKPDRNTVGEVYDQVVEDLMKAEGLMNQAKSASYATKEAAQALLSRVYLYMGENQKAIEYADKVINSGRYSLLGTEDFKQYNVFTPENNAETIFAIKFTKESDYGHGWYTIGSLYANIKGTGWGEMYASKSYLDLLHENANDAREAFIDPQYLTDDNGDEIPNVMWVDANYKYQTRPTYEEAGKLYFDNAEGVKTEVLSENMEGETAFYFVGSQGKVYVEKSFEMAKRNGYPKYYILKASMQEGEPQLWSPTVSRLAEMYLNKAEAYAKLGDTQQALDNVNIIRERAGISMYNGLSDLKEGQNVLEAVLQERRLELAFEGHRKFDVFRNNMTMDRHYPGTHLNGNDPYYEVLPNDPRVIEFIPESQIAVQPSLIQND